MAGTYTDELVAAAQFAVDTYGTRQHAEAITHLEDMLTGGPEETVECKFCHTQVPANTAHRHDGGYVGDACGCWDERLRMTE